MKFHKIQDLRALAAILVAIDHALTFLVGHGFTQDQLTPVAWFIGEQGVAIFFIISGFIMTYTTRNAFGSAASTLDFLWHRAIRVIPLYWLFTFVAATLVMSGLWLKGLHVAGLDVLRSLAFMPYGKDGGALRPVLGQGWTLNYEIGFYALFAFALLMRRRVGLVTVCAILGLLVLRGIVWGGVWQGIEPATVADFYASPLLLLFVVGILIGDLAIHRRWRVAPLLVRHGLVLVALGLAAMTAAFVLLLDTYRIPLPWRLAFWALDGLFVLGAVMAGDAVAGAGKRLWERLGDASYSIYLVHFFALTVVAKVWGSVLHWHVPWLFPVIGPCAGIVAGLLTYRFIEKPLTDHLRRVPVRQKLSRA